VSARLARGLIVAAVLALVAGLVPATGDAAAAPPAPVGHVFVIVLENESADTTFGPGSAAPFLSQTLRAQGAFVPGYYGIGHLSNPNYIAMISGQAPNLQTQLDCQSFDNLFPGKLGAFEQAQGTGCVYPSAVPTIASQLDAAGLTWRDYNDGMGADPVREAGECGHPGVGMVDGTQSATATDQYATRHNPFVYFHSIIDDTTLCDSRVVNLNLLSRDLAAPATTPAYAFITPSLCNDGHDAKCAGGGPGGLAAADAFLRLWVPRITGSAAFRRQNGLLLITFDEATSSDTASCCGEIAGPGSPLPGLTGAGGGRVGAVLLSPCIAPGTVSAQAYNHYGMLRSVEDLFGLGHIGYAAMSSVSSFGSDVFSRRCDGLPVVRLGLSHGSPRGGSVPVRLRWRTTSVAYASSFDVEVRRIGRRPSAWVMRQRAATGSSLRYAARPGFRYGFRVRGHGVAGTGGWSTAKLSLTARR
jgi:hypothetical protein